MANGGGSYHKAFELGRELFCHGARRGSLSSRRGPHPPVKIGTRGPHYTRENRDGGPHSPSRIVTGVPILPKEWGPGVPDKGDPQNFMTPAKAVPAVPAPTPMNMAWYRHRCASLDFILATSITLLLGTKISESL